MTGFCSSKLWYSSMGLRIPEKRAGKFAKSINSAVHCPTRLTVTDLSCFTFMLIFVCIRTFSLLSVVLCDTRDTSILIVDTYATILVSPMSRYTAVYRSSTKYRETAQVSRVSSILYSSYHLVLIFSNVHTTSLMQSIV